MSKVNTIDALIASALELFSTRGFEGVSLRDIATHADVPLSSINTYFGSKAQIYAAVYGHIWGAVGNERSDMLAAALSVPASQVDLKAVIRALVAPVVRRACGGEEGRRIARMLGFTPLTVPADVDRNVLHAVKWDTSLAEWVDALQTACPGLSRAEAVWGFSFIAGALYSPELLLNRYSLMLHEDDALGPEEVTEMLVEMAASGLAAMARRRAAPDQGNRTCTDTP